MFPPTSKEVSLPASKLDYFSQAGHCSIPWIGDVALYLACGGGLTCTIRLMNHTKYPLLSTIASLAPFETAVGMNGRVWFKTQSITEGIAIKRVVEDVNEGLLDGTDKQAVERALKGYLA